MANRTIESDDASPARHQIHQTLERGFDRIEILVDVGMIKLDRGQNHCIGKVVEELGPLIEEGGIVFVAFEDEVLPRAEMKARPEVFGDAAYQERRFKSGGVENPGKHRRGGGFAVSSSDDQNFLTC